MTVDGFAFENSGGRPGQAGKGWREFMWGGIAGAFGETMMHPVDTLKTRIQSGARAGLTAKRYRNINDAFKSVWAADGTRGMYRGVAPALTGSLVTGATYFGVIEASKDFLYDTRPQWVGPWSHFLAGALGEAISSVVYVPLEVVKQRMQLQGSRATWEAAARAAAARGGHPPSYVYYNGMLQAFPSILRNDGIRGLYAGYWSTLVRDVPFAGFQIMFYEAQREALYFFHKQHHFDGRFNGASHEFTSAEELLMGGLAGGLSAFLTTPCDVIKTRIQVQGTTDYAYHRVHCLDFVSKPRYSGWLDALRCIWRDEGLQGLYKGGVPRVLWFVPASALTFMALEQLRKRFERQLHQPQVYALPSHGQNKPPGGEPGAPQVESNPRDAMLAQPAGRMRNVQGKGAYEL